MGQYTTRLSSCTTTMHHLGSHRYTVLAWMDCMMPYPDGMIAHACAQGASFITPSLVSPSWSIPVNELGPFHCLSPRVWVSSHTPMRHQAPNVWVLQRHLDTLSQDLRVLVGKCFALSPILLSPGSAHSGMDDASYNASFRLLCASLYFICLTEACSVSQSCR